MKTVQEMYNYCLVNGFDESGSKKWVLKNFKLIEERLQNDESVLMVFIGHHKKAGERKSEGEFTYALTNKRLIMAQKKMIGENISSLAINILSNTRLVTDGALGIIKFSTSREIFSVELERNHAINVQEKIQTLISTRKEEGAPNRKGEKIGKTAEEMYDYQIIHEFGSEGNKRDDIKNFKLIEENLQRDEEVLMSFKGVLIKEGTKSESVSDVERIFAYVLTDKRFIMAQKRRFEKVSTVLISMLNDIHLSVGALSGKIEFDTVKEKFSISTSSRYAKNIHRKIQMLLLEMEENTVDSAAQTTQYVEPRSDADEIRKYKELLDDGIITEEEFNVKKKEILGI